jgi:hypothetical protein
MDFEEGDHVLWIPSDIDECKKDGIKGLETLTGVITCINALFFDVEWDDTCKHRNQLGEFTSFDTWTSIYFHKIE